MTIAHNLRLAGYGNTYGTAKTVDFMLYIFVHILTPSVVISGTKTIHCPDY